MPNLTASWEAASIRSLLRGDVSAYARNGTHTQTLCPGENKDHAMAALLHLQNEVKGFCTGEYFLGKLKKKPSLPPACLTMNLSKATERI